MRHKLSKSITKINSNIFSNNYRLIFQKGNFSLVGLANSKCRYFSSVQSQQRTETSQIQQTLSRSESQNHNHINESIKPSDREGVLLLQVGAQPDSIPRIATVTLRRTANQRATVLSAVGDQAIYNAVKSILYANQWSNGVNAVSGLENDGEGVQQLYNYFKRKIKGEQEKIKVGSMSQQSMIKSDLEVTSKSVNNEAIDSESESDNDIDSSTQETKQQINQIDQSIKLSPDSVSRIFKIDGDCPIIAKIRPRTIFEGVFRTKEEYDPDQYLCPYRRLESLKLLNQDQISDRDSSVSDLKSRQMTQNVPLFSQDIPRRDRGFYIGFVPHHVTDQSGDLIYTKLEVVQILERPQPIKTSSQDNQNTSTTDSLRESFNVCFPSHDKFAQAIRVCHTNWYKWIFRDSESESSDNAKSDSGADSDESDSDPTHVKPPLMQAFGPKNVALGIRILAKTRLRMNDSGSTKVALPEFALYPTWHRDSNGMTGVNLQFFELG